ncbi:MAG TPA: riboflavin synthase [Candidatus Polarisedimenticolia bacterium]|nr:riboflavin synthase [Candidatus Polarisedimenticolia bacterium]
MFTGIIEHVGKIDALEIGADGGRLRVNLAGSPEMAAQTQLGDSISVNGCCLTVVEFDAEHFSADLSGETLRCTSLGEKKPGDVVNLERPLAAGARLGGHFVQGHVDGVGRVAHLTPAGENWWLSVRVPEDLWRYVAEKGSIAIDGISLTVARWRDGAADVAVIPFTYAQTNVHAMVPGSAVNLECDVLAKYVESLLGSRKTPAASQLTVSRLVEEGF